VQTLALRVPAEGEYLVEIALDQDGGTRFTAPGNTLLRLQVVVAPAHRAPAPGGRS
jgi:hypothetical protein